MPKIKLVKILNLWAPDHLNMFETIKHNETIIKGNIFVLFWCRYTRKQYGQINIDKGILNLPIEVIEKINPKIK